MPVEVQQRDDADEFTGTTDQGLFTWEDLDALPRTARVVLETVDLRILPGVGSPVELTRIFLRPRGAGATDPSVTIGFVQNMANPDFSADIHGVGSMVREGEGLIAGGPPRVVPRTSAGEHWELAFVTEEKARTGFAIVDWRVEPFGPPGL